MDYYLPPAPGIKVENVIYIFSLNWQPCVFNIPVFPSSIFEHMNLCTPYKSQQFPTFNSPIYYTFLSSFKFMSFFHALVFLNINLYVHISLNTRRPIHTMLQFCMFLGLYIGCCKINLCALLWERLPLPLPAFLNDYRGLCLMLFPCSFCDQFSIPTGILQLRLTDLNHNCRKFLIIYVVCHLLSYQIHNNDRETA